MRVCLVLCLLSCRVAGADDFVPFVIPAEVNPKSLIALPSGPAIKPDGERITVKDDKFYVRKERFKVWGVNLCFSANFPTHKDAESVAARLAAFGVNSVRFHHMDSANYPAGIWDPKEKNKFHSEALERLDYFIDQLAQKGIYANINLHVGREHSKTLGLPDGPEGQDKMIDLFTPQLIEAQKQYARDLLGHVNQYRKVRYADDAAVAFVEINNENSLFMWSAPSKLPKLPEFYAKRLQEKYFAWLKEKYGTTEKLAAAWNKDAVPLGPNLLPKDTPLAAGGKPGWHLEQHEGCEATVKPLKDDKLSGVRIEIAKSDSEGWHIQFNCPGLTVSSTKPYTVTFLARADAPRSISYGVSMAHAPWGSLGLNGTADLTKEWKTFQAGFTPSADHENGRLNFQLSGHAASLEIADVSFQVGGGEGLHEREALDVQHVRVFPELENKARQFDRLRFFAETELAYFRDMKQFIQKDLGCQAVVTGTIVFGPLGMWAQQDMDYIDAHAYWQHPHFPGRQWDLDNWTIEQKAMVDSPEKSTLPTLAASRLAGKPFTVSEYNHPAPNDYQAECVPMLAAFGASQDWDGVWFFAYSHNQEWDKPYFDSFFDMRSNPAKWGFMLPGGILFKTANRNWTTDIGVLAEEPTLNNVCAAHIKHQLNMAEVVCEIAGEDAKVSQIAEQPIALAFREIQKSGAPRRPFKPEITWTDRLFDSHLGSAGGSAIGWKSNSSLDPESFPPDMFPKIDGWFADMGVDLTKVKKGSPSFLYTVCGRCENAGMNFSADRRSVGRNWGKGPARIEAPHVIHPEGVALPNIKTTCQALGPDGVPTAVVPLTKSPDGKYSCWDLGPKYGTMWYLFTLERAK